MLGFGIFSIKKVRYQDNGLLRLQEFLFALAFTYLTAFLVVSTAVESTAALVVSTATTVESALGASSAFLGVQDAKAIATTKNNNTFFISFKLLKI
ncbi:MAG: hypothetical protein P4L34_10995 [Paludibacter sp.]|nr:hypothetical protein [Paludibacter sp.]